MADKIYIIKARNTVTGMTLKQQDLTGNQWPNNKQGRVLAEDLARQFAEKLTARNPEEPWEGFVELHVPSVRDPRR